eukprot:5508675-Pyramimonas_sp.AAC.1
MTDAKPVGGGKYSAGVGIWVRARVGATLLDAFTGAACSSPTELWQCASMQVRGAALSRHRYTCCKGS